MGNLTGIKEKLDAYVARHERLYPHAYDQIHKVACKNCPSVVDKQTGNVDPESEMIKATMTKEQQVHEALFVCGWRNSKLCKGNCDDLGIDEDFIKKVKTENLPSKEA